MDTGCSAATRSAVVVLLLVAGAVSLQRTPAIVAHAAQPSAPGEEIPGRYRSLYRLLAAELDEFERRYPRRGAGTVAPMWGAELLQANGNRADALLQPRAMPGVRLFLDRFQAMGFRAVTISVPCPLLVPSFPRSAEYAAFYREVAREVRRRGMKLEVESGVLFANTAFSPLKLDFKASSFSDFVAGRRQHVAAIVREMAPDWLDLGAEPDTEAKLSGFAQLNDPDDRAAMLGSMLDGLERGTTRIATGIGTWSDTRFLTVALARVKLDAVALHLYPLGPKQLNTLSEACRIARQAGKPVLLDEAWLYKIGPGENEGFATNEKVFKRDIWSFWTPLDRRFLETVDAFARTERVAYVSPFWSHLYFATLPYDAALDEGSYQAANARYLQAVLAALTPPGRLSPLGETVSGLITRTSPR